ncbi:MAG: GNAT family N-acetyltransferase [Planctomycetales bacterium]|nr:GNAT family N-acetyltransferase [Planctomycetales bacterium]
MTTIENKAAAEITADVWDAWRDLVSANPELASPYFQPEFTQAIAALRDDVEVALVRDSGVIVAILPFQRAAGSIGRPVGGPLSDFQGVIAAPGYEVDPLALIRACHLSRWEFDHLLATQKEFSACQIAAAPSPYLDVRGGFDAYLARRTNPANDELKQAERRRRKIERERGSLRFHWQSHDKAILETLFQWKSQQYQATQLTDVFSFDWTRALLKRLLRGDHAPVTGLLSTLHAGEQLIAVHYAMCAGGVLHSWFPAYDPTFSKYSPGMLLFVEILRATETHGIEHVDLGKGDEPYKLRLMTGQFEVSEGAVTRSPVARMLRRQCRAAKQWVKNSKFRPTVERPAQWLRHWRERALFE